MKRQFLSLILIFIASGIAWCKPTTVFPVSGRVTDPQGRPIDYATVNAGAAFVCQTDSAGKFSLNLPSGTYTLTAEFAGYQKEVREIAVGSPTKCNFILVPEARVLDKVVITEKSQTRKLKESEFNVSSVDIKTSVNTGASVADIVGRTSGVKIRTEGGLGSDFEVSLNGLSGSAVRYFIDGVAMDTRGSNVDLSNLPLSTIERVNIYKGVVPAFLGSDALGGAINIVTRKEKSNYLDAAMHFGSFKTVKTDISGQYIIPSTGIILRPAFNFSYSKNDYLMRNVEVWDAEADRYVDADRKRFHDAYRSFYGQIEGGVERKSWADALFVSVSYSYTHKQIQTGSTQAVVYGKAFRKSGAWNIAARYSKANLLINRLNFNLTASYTADHSITVDTAYRKYNWNGHYINSPRNEISGGAPSIMHYIRPLTLVRANLEYAFNPHHSLNLNYNLNSVRNRRFDDLNDDYRPSHDILSKNIIGLTYTQNFFGRRLANSFFGKSYIEYLRLVKEDNYWNSEAVEKKTKAFTGYGLGSRFRLREQFQIKASYEHSVRLPLSKELLGNGLTVYPSLNLKPENSDNINAGIFGSFNFAGSHTLYYEVNGNLRRVKDMIHLVIAESAGTSQYTNIANVTVTGIEGELSYHFADMIHLTTNWSYSETRDMNRLKADGKPSVTYKDRVPNRPWLYGNTEVTFLKRKLFTTTDRIRVGYIYQYVHWFYLTWAGYGSLSSKAKIPTQNSQNAYVTYSWKSNRYNVTFEVDNIFNRTLYDNYKLQKPGRSFMLTFRLYLN